MGDEVDDKAGTTDSDSPASELEREVLDAVASGASAGPRGADPSDAEAWDTERTVRAEFLRRLALSGLEGGRPLLALKLHGARITGVLDLSEKTLPFPVLLESCYFERAPMLAEAQLPSLRLSGSHMPGLFASQIKTTGDMALGSDFTSTETVVLRGAQIGGCLVLSGARLASPDGRALSASRITVTQDFYCDDGFTATGAVELADADLGGLSLDNATLDGRDGPAFTGDRLVVKGSLTCIGEFVATGEVRLAGAKIGGQLALRGATLENPSGSALSADGITVGQGLFCHQGFTATGTVRLLGGQISGPVVLNGAHLSCPDGIALNGDGLNATTNSFFCSEGFVADGEVRLVGAEIAGQLVFSAARFTNPGGTAINADGVTIGQALFCDERFAAEGQVRLIGARIGGQASFRNASVESVGSPALNADRMVAAQGLFCDQQFVARGEVRLLGARIGGQLTFRGSRIENPGGIALHADRILVESSTYCDGGFAVAGTVRFFGGQFDGGLSFDRAQLSAKGGLALDLGHAKASRLSLLFGAIPEGGIDAQSARVVSLNDDPALWPIPHILRDFQYDALERSSAPTERLAWITSAHGGYQPQLYDQLQAFYRRAGRDDDARRVAIAKHTRHRDQLSGPSYWANYLFGATVGYGYRTWRAVYALLAIIGISWVVFACASWNRLDDLKARDQLPEFSPLLYAIDSVLPVVDLGQEAARGATGWVLYWHGASVLAGWVLATALIGALTSRLARD